MRDSLQKTGYLTFKSIFQQNQFEELLAEFHRLEGVHLEKKDISKDNYDADQKRFEVMNPPFLTGLYKGHELQEFLANSVQEPLKVNNRCGYFSYLEGSYIKPHYDHILTDCMLIIGLQRIYGKGRGGILRVHVPAQITFNRNDLGKHKDEECKVIELDVKAGDAILLAGGYLLHECTPLEEGGSRLICGMGFALKRNKN